MRPAAGGVAGLARRGLASVRSVSLAALVATLAGVALAGCGGIKAPDLFIVQRSGSGPHAKLTLLVNEEGGVHCNGVGSKNGSELKLSDPQLVQARAIQEGLEEPSTQHTSLAPGAKSVLHYFVRDEHGYVRFSDDSAGQPKVFRQVALFVLQAAQSVCGLPE
ncbi:MAG TPA: hypothetical protein VH081_02300 [Solirubrobacteraceae bacterium]|jgi:hypothetical protein|nr:hypothetical protein [Solirubrobacteraceae bacterium]